MFSRSRKLQQGFSSAALVSLTYKTSKSPVTWLLMAEPGLETTSSDSQPAWLVFQGAGLGKEVGGKQQQKQTGVGPADSAHGQDGMHNVGEITMCSPGQGQRENMRGEIGLRALLSSVSAFSFNSPSSLVSYPFFALPTGSSPRGPPSHPDLLVHFPF